MLQAKTEEQKEYVRSKLSSVGGWVGDFTDDSLELDGWFDFDAMAQIVDYLRGDTLIIDLSTKEAFDDIGKVLQFETTDALLKSLWNNCEQAYSRTENNNLKMTTEQRQQIAAQAMCALINKAGLTANKKQLVDNAIAYADMLARRLAEIPADAQQRSEQGQKNKQTV